MFNLKSDLWFGYDAESFKQALALEARAEAFFAALPADGKSFTAEGASPTRDRGGEQLPRMYSRQGNVGVITIRGPLINAENIFTQIFDISTYPAIREALTFGAHDAKVTDILLDIESPGGQVSGTNDVAKLVKTVDTQHKPVHAFSDSLVASAAYWIASGARHLGVGETAIAGSIGVIATMQSVHKALEKEGVEVKVVRAGKNKALGHPAEPISDKAVAKMQAHADALYGIFTSTVSANRPALKLAKQGEWAEGTEFLGQDAVDAHLADSVTTFDQTLASLVQNVDAPKTSNNNAGTRTRGMQMKPRAALDPKIVAAIEAGAPLTPEQEAAVAAATAADAAQPTDNAPAAAVENAAAGVATDAGAATEGAPSAATPAPEAPKQTAPELVAYLEGQVTAKDKELLDLKVQLAEANKKIESMEGSHSKLRAIAEASASKMNVALGGAALTMTGLTDAELVAKHEVLTADFRKNFKVDGVASSTPEPKEKTAAAKQADPKHRAQIARVGLTAVK